MPSSAPGPSGSNADDDTQGGIGAIFAALGDDTRRAILEVLGRRGEATATGLVGQVPVSRQAITRHLAVLADAGLIVSRREGREVVYTVSEQRAHRRIPLD